MGGKIPQFTKGFAEDASRIILKYKKSEEQSFKCFCDIWKDMKFGQVFTGRRTSAEVMEISEEFLNTAKYFLIQQDDAKIKQGGLFLLYCLYYSQPFAKFAKIRLICSEWLNIKEWWLSLDKNVNDEPIYMFTKLYHDDAFKFVLENRAYGFEKSLNKYFKELPDSLMMPFHMVMENTSSTADQNELQTLAQEAKTVCTKYQEFRKKLNLQSNSNIMPVLDNLCIKNVEKTQLKDNDPNEALGKKRKELKDKAFTSAQPSYFRSPTKQIRKNESSNESSDDDDDDAEGAKSN